MNIKAFPCKLKKDSGHHEFTVFESGMDLRDYFATQTLPQILFLWQRMDSNIDFEDRAGDAENIARQSYLIADAMIKERNNNNNKELTAK